MLSVPEIIAHRGAPREHRENTLRSFRRAVELGADAIELDVHMTRDGVVVVHHDATVRPRTTSSGAASIRINDLGWDELRALEAGERDPIPSLPDVLGEMAGRVRVYVEVKDASADAAVAGMLRPYAATCAVHAFDHRVTRRVRDLAPGLPGGILLDSYLIATAAAMRHAGARDVWQRWELVDASLVREVHGAGGRVIAWTVDDLEAARRLATLGVDGICSDVPGAMRAMLGVE
jgi:glycerophosphoryl diester phosphodiesterase